MQIFTKSFSIILNQGALIFQLIGSPRISTIQRLRPRRGNPKLGLSGYRIIKGNNEADRMAVRAAELARLPEEICDDLKEHTNMSHCNQNRLATIITHLPNRKRIKSNPVPTPAKESKEQAMAKSEHKLSTSGAVVRCSVCLSQCNFNSTCFWEFIKSKCKPAECPFTFNVISISGQVRVGNISSHISHGTFSYRGIKCCGYCGYMAGTLMRSLKQQRKGVQGRTDHGQRVLDALASGILPPNVTAWPDD